MPKWTLQSSILRRCSWIHLAWRRYLEGHLKEHGVSMKHAFVLRYLEEHPDAAPSALAAELFSDRPTTTSLLDTMQRRGWVERRPDPEDGRRLRLRLTAAGRAKVKSLPPAASRAVPQELDPLAPLSEAERKTLESLLERVERHLTKESREAGEPLE
jgi:DNA-binding MarR family transcriptional regulator